MAEEMLIVNSVVEEDPEVIHITCHCTDMKISGCGKDISNEEFASSTNDAPTCAMCLLIWNKDMFKCPWGCDCISNGDCCG